MAEPKPLEYVAGSWTGRGRPKPVTIADLPTGGGEVAWTDVTGKPATFAPTIGTTATTALAGDTPIPAEATWANLSGKPAVIAAGADAAAARTAIGAGTSSLALGTTSSTAKAGDYAPAWGDVTGKPAVIAAGADAAAARTAIGAGTSNLTLAQSQAGIATKAAIAALTPESTLEDVIAALQA